MGKVVAFINMKGGVGKTTLCLGIGDYLAHYFEKKILFIDVDPQFNTTQSLMNEFNLEEEYLSNFYKTKTITKLFQSPTTITEKPKLPTPDEVIINLDSNIDIIAGTINLIFEDTSKDGGKTRRISKFIKDNNLRDKYDYIFIDCPPTISLYTDAALIASDFYLVPNRIDRYSILGIKLLKQVIDRLTFDENLDIKPLGIVYTMVKDETKKSGLLKDSFEGDEIVKDIGLFSSGTSYVNDLLVGLQGNISSKYKKSCEDIDLVCKEFLERIGNYE
jgi:chromosome partitioning protein